MLKSLISFVASRFGYQPIAMEKEVSWPAIQQCIFHCPSPFWSRQAQILLNELTGAKWHPSDAAFVPSNADERYFGLVDYSPKNGFPKGKGWTFCRAPKIDHKAMGFPIKDARSFVLHYKPGMDADEPNQYKALLVIDSELVTSIYTEGKSIEEVLPQVRSRAIELFNEGAQAFELWPDLPSDNLRIVRIENIDDQTDSLEIQSVVIRARTHAEQTATNVLSVLVASPCFEGIPEGLRSQLREALQVLINAGQNGL